MHKIAKVGDQGKVRFVVCEDLHGMLLASAGFELASERKKEKETERNRDGERERETEIERETERE